MKISEKAEIYEILRIIIITTYIIYSYSTTVHNLCLFGFSLVLGFDIYHHLSIYIDIYIYMYIFP